MAKSRQQHIRRERYSTMTNTLCNNQATGSQTAHCSQLMVHVGHVASVSHTHKTLTPITASPLTSSAASKSFS